MNKLLLIDGNSIMNRAFYGVPDMTTQDGRHTNAIFGFLNIILKVIQEEQATHICVAFDLKKKTFRHEMYSEYKGTRKGMPDELREQMPIIKTVLKAMNISIVEQEGYEADDLLGTLSRIGEQNDYKVTVLSGDRDLLQLATETVLIRIPKTKQGKTEIENYYAEDVMKTYGVNPRVFIDMKGLMGDSSDNIPGVPGIGEKTASKLLNQYGSIEGVYTNIDEMKQSKVKENLVNNKELAFLSKTLATIKLDCDITTSIDSMKYENPFNMDTYKLFQNLELKSFFRYFNEVEEEKNVDIPIEVIEDYDRYVELMQSVNETKMLGFSFLKSDTETLGISLCFPDGYVYLVKFMLFIQEDMVVNELLSIVNEKSILLCCMDIKKELQFLSLRENSVFDAGLAAYLIQPNQAEYNYDDIAKAYLNINLESEKELLGKEILNMFSFEEEKTKKYMAYKSFVPVMSMNSLVQKMESMDLKNLYDKIELPCAFTLYEMEKNGIRVDGEALALYGTKLKSKIETLTNEIYTLAGEAFNINSTKQLGEILFEKLGLKSGKKTKTGYSTSQEVLEKISSEHEIISLILEYRQLTKLNSTYAEGLANYISYDGRIHGTFHQKVTVTGRISSADPNLQNIPTRVPLGREIRKVFIPEDGYVFVDADYSQIELRVLAHMSGDEALIEAYQTNSDIHAITASQVFDVPLDQVDSSLRRKAKAVNFGIVYGISSFGLGQDLDISRKEAESYIEKYFTTYKKVKQFLDDTIDEAKKNGYTTTMYKRRRPIPELSSSNFMQRSFGERAAMNSPVQGTAADIIKLAMIKVHAELKNRKLKSRLVLQIHDELIIETKKEELEEVKTLLEQEMMHAAKLSVPLLVEANVGKSWYDAK